MSRNHSRKATLAFVVGGSVLFLIPLVFGGWTLPGFPALPKALSQFRNPSLGLAGLILFALLLRVATPSSLVSAASRLSPDRLVLPLLAIYGVAYLKASFLDYAGFSLNAIDFSMYDHALANTIRGRFMETVTGVNHFGIHATPILFLLLPFHAVFDSPLFALFLHPMVLWSGALALDLLLRRKGIRGWERIGILFAYLNCILVARTLHYGFHVEAFYPLFGFLLLSSISMRKPLAIFLALVLFLSVKEDAPFYAFGIFAAAALTRRIAWPAATGYTVFSTAVATYYLLVLIPENSSGGAYTFVGAAAGFGVTPRAALSGALSDPLQVLRNVFAGGGWTMILPSIGLLVLSPFFWIAAIPFFGIYALAGSPLMTGLSLYYGMPLVPLLFYGWIDGMKRETLPKRRVFSLAIAVAGLSLVGGGYLVFRKADLSRWRSIAPIAEELARQEKDPEFAGTKLCAPGVLVPHLGYPKNLRLLSADCLRDAGRVVIAESSDSPRLSTYPMAPEEYEFALQAVSAWPVLLRSGEFSLRRRP